MSNIHLGEEITVINMTDAGNSFSNLAAMADDLKQSFGGLKPGVDDATQTIHAFNDTLCEVDGILRSEFMNDISVAGQEALMLGNTMQVVNTQFRAFLQTYIQSGFLQQIEQMLFLSATEINQLNQAIDGKLLPAIALLTQDAIMMAKAGGGGDGWLDKVDKGFDIIDHGINIFNGGREIYKSFKGGAGVAGEEGEDFFQSDAFNTKEGETFNTLTTDGEGISEGSTLGAGTAELGGAEEEVGIGILEGLEELSLAIGPEGWIVAGLIGLGTVIYRAVKNNAEEDQKNNTVQYGGGDFVGSRDSGTWDIRGNAGNFIGNGDTLIYMPSSADKKGEVFNYTRAPGYTGYKWEPDENSGDSAYMAPLTTGSGGLPYPESMTSNPYSNLPSTLEPGQKQKCVNIVFNINTMAQFNDTYTGVNESLNDIHDKIVKVLTDAVRDAKVAADIH